MLVLRRRIQMGVAQRDAQRPVRQLVDVADREATAVVADVVVQPVALDHLAAQVHRDRALAELQRANRAQVGGARKTHARDLGVRRLVDHHPGQQFGRILVELHRAVVAGARLLAAVQERGGEVGRQTADRDHLRPSVDALGRQTGQARDRFGDRHVRKLADVLGRHRLDDRSLVALGADGVRQPAPQAGDDDLVDFGRLVAVVRRRRRLLGEGRRRQSRRQHHGGGRQAQPGRRTRSNKMQISQCAAHVVPLLVSSACARWAARPFSKRFWKRFQR